MIMLLNCHRLSLTSWAREDKTIQFSTLGEHLAVFYRVPVNSSTGLIKYILSDNEEGKKDCQRKMLMSTPGDTCLKVLGRASGKVLMDPHVHVPCKFADCGHSGQNVPAVIAL